MADAAEPPRGPWGSWADWIIVWLIGPLATWAMDIAQGLSAHIPVRSLYGTTSAAASGLAASAGLYAFMFLAVRSVLEVPRCVVSLMRGSSARVPPILVGILALVAIAWLGL